MTAYSARRTTAATEVGWEQMDDDHYVVTCTHTTTGLMGAHTDTITQTCTTREAAEAMCDTLRARFASTI